MRDHWLVIWFAVFMPLLFALCGVWVLRIAEYCFTATDYMGNYESAFLPGATVAAFAIPGYIVSLCVVLYHFKSGRR